jgi:hypothetical protein
MQAFLSTYSVRIVLGLFAPIMVGMHSGHGMGHGGDGRPDSGGHAAEPGESDLKAAAGTNHRHSGF